IYNALVAGDTNIDQAATRMSANTRVFLMGGAMQPFGYEDVLILMLSAGMLALGLMVVRAPAAVLAGFLGRRAIRRENILCRAEVRGTLGRRVYQDGFLRGAMIASVVAGLVLTLAGHVQWAGFMWRSQPGWGFTVTSTNWYQVMGVCLLVA